MAKKSKAATTTVTETPQWSPDETTATDLAVLLGQLTSSLARVSALRDKWPKREVLKQLELLRFMLRTGPGMSPRTAGDGEQLTFGIPVRGPSGLEMGLKSSLYSLPGLLDDVDKMLEGGDPTQPLGTVDPDKVNAAVLFRLGHVHYQLALWVDAAQKHRGGSGRDEYVETVRKWLDEMERDPDYLAAIEQEKKAATNGTLPADNPDLEGLEFIASPSGLVKLYPSRSLILFRDKQRHGLKVAQLRAATTVLEYQSRRNEPRVVERADDAALQRLQVDAPHLFSARLTGKRWAFA